MIGVGLGGGLYPYVASSTARWAILDGREPFVRDIVTRFYDHSGPVEDAVATMVGFPFVSAVPARAHQDRSESRRCACSSTSSRRSYDGWVKNGDAFLSSPSADPPMPKLVVVGAAGRRLAELLRARRGDLATGELISPPFTIDRSHLSLLVGGGAAARDLRAALGGRRGRVRSDRIGKPRHDARRMGRDGAPRTDGADRDPRSRPEPRRVTSSSIRSSCSIEPPLPPLLKHEEREERLAVVARARKVLLAPKW